MTKVLSEAQVQRYRRDGFVSPITALSSETAREYRARFEAYEETNGGWYEYSKGGKLHLVQTWAAELATHPVILDAVEDILGPDLLCWGVSLFVKEPHQPSYVSWHQDATYWGLSGPEVATAWVALSSASEKAGCMKMIPGSQTWDQVSHKDTLAPDNLLTRGQEIAVEVDEEAAVSLPLEPGEISLHHILTAHASAPNESDDRRIGLAIRYIPPSLKQIGSVRGSALLVRGRDVYGHFEHETLPKADMDTDAMEEYQRIQTIRQAVLYQGVQGSPAHTASE